MTLVSCAKEIDTVSKEDAISEEGIPFEFVANPETKTTIDGLQTKWAADDAVNLFHAVAGSTTYESDGEFTIASEDLATGTFKGTLKESLASGSYDWYAVYPHNKYITSIHNVGDNPARYYIGCREDKAQVQTGNNSTAHLSGANYPLYGKASAVSYDAMPSVTLSNIASFVKIDVTNKNEEPLTVSNIVFTAPDGSEIVGQYNIDFAAEPLVFTKYSTYAADYATLTVESGEPIAKDETASFYIGIKPFTAAAGSDFKVSVNGYEKTIHTTKANTFESGKIKTVAFDYDAEPVGPDPYSWVKTPIGSLVAGDVIVIVDETSSRALSSANGSSSLPVATAVTISSNKLTASPAENLQFVFEVPSAGNYSFKAVNSTDYLYTTDTNKGVRVGSNANKVFVWDSGYLKNVATGRYVGVYDSQDWRCYTSINANIENTQTAFYKKVSLTPSEEHNITIAPTSHGTVTTSPASKAEEGALVTITVTPEDGYALTSLAVIDASSASVTVTDNKFSMPSSDVTITAVFGLQASVTALKTSIDGVPAAGVAAEVETGVYSLTNATDSNISVTFDGTVVTDAEAAGGEVLYSVAANTGAARTGWIKIAVAGGNAIKIDVNQLAGVAGKTYTITWNSTNNSKSVTSYTDDWTVTADGITCNMQNFNNNSNKWEYVKCGRKNNASVATIITAVAIPETIKTVTLTIDALTADKINSIKLYTSSDSSSWAEAGSFSKSTGDQSVIISSPAANLYYKIECDCASGSSNGLLTISKLILTTY